MKALKAHKYQTVFALLLINVGGGKKRDKRRRLSFYEVSFIFNFWIKKTSKSFTNDVNKWIFNCNALQKSFLQKGVAERFCKSFWNRESSLLPNPRSRENEWNVSFRLPCQSFHDCLSDEKILVWPIFRVIFFELSSYLSIFKATLSEAKWRLSL